MALYPLNYSDLNCRINNIKLFNLKGHQMQGQRLIQSLLLVSILTPTVTFAFTMADMEVNSALNQKLDADIPISLAPNEKPHDISVKMAAPIVFEQHKISRHSLLDKVQFKRIGTAIQITSNSPINAPTLDFILEINSRKGPTYQRYKITLNKNATENKVSSRAIEASKLVPVAINVDTKPVATPLATLEERLNKDNTFGPIQKADSFTKIAKHIAKLHGINTKIVVNALRYNNPNAFHKGSHGALKTGEFLVIPDFNEAKPAEVDSIATKAIITATPLTTISKVEPAVIPAPITSTPLQGDINAQQLQARVEQLEHHVEQIQKELAVLQTQAPANLTMPVEPKIEKEMPPISPTTPIETIVETLPIAASISVEDTANPSASTNTNSALLILEHPWLLTFLATSLLGLLAWIAMRFVNNRRTKNKKIPSSKNLKGAFKDSDIESPIPKKASSAAPRNNSAKIDSINLDAQNEDFEFDFLKSQVNTTRMKKLNRPSRYPSDINDNLKK